MQQMHAANINTGRTSCVYLAEILKPVASSPFYRLILDAAAWEKAAPSEELETAFYRTFRQWLWLSLQRQEAEIDDLLSGQPESQRVDLEQWFEHRGYESLVPARAFPCERILFLDDLKLFTELLLPLLRGVPVRA